MRYAKTGFVAILSADDMWAPVAVLVLNRYFDKYPGIDLFHSSRVKIDENNNPVSSIYYTKENFSTGDFIFNSPVKHLLCWRKEKALAVGGLNETLNSVKFDDYVIPWSLAENEA